ncbi:hypothetical protein KXS11_08570 [Plantibacter flavus]|uniref:hypothetical protein n=1 Tax=Plantibacter flavus TaxID=150123 RepID=UPI003F13CB4C
MTTGTPVRSTIPGRFRIGRLTGLIVGAVLATVIVTPLSMAFWTAGDTVPAFSIRTGSASLSVSGGDDSAPPSLYPGASEPFAGHLDPVVVENTGDVALTVRFRVERAGTGSEADIAFSNALVVTAWFGEDCSTGVGDAASFTGSTSGPTSDDDVLGTLEPGALERLCAVLSLPIDADASLQAATAPSLVLILDGEQVRP